MKLINSIVLIVLVLKVCLSYECKEGTVKSYGMIGDKCKINNDCKFPDICYDGVCKKLRMPGQECKVKSDCTLSFNYADCVNGKCELIIGVGDKCNSSSNVVGSGKCTSSSECVNGICKFKVPCNKYNCPLNTFCDIDGTKQCKSISSNVNTIKCKSDYMCPSTHVCLVSSGKCIEKYSIKLGDKCYFSPFACNLFNGEICDQTTNKCIVNKKYGKQCDNESTCNGGLCVCTDQSKSICVGISGELKNPICKQLELKYHQCILSEKCSSSNPVTCRKCFKQHECLEYQCNSIEKYYKYKSNYYNSLNCSTSTA